MSTSFRKIDQQLIKRKWKYTPQVVDQFFSPNRLSRLVEESRQRVPPLDGSYFSALEGGFLGHRYQKGNHVLYAVFFGVVLLWYETLGRGTRYHQFFCPWEYAFLQSASSDDRVFQRFLTECNEMVLENKGSDAD